MPVELPANVSNDPVAGRALDSLTFSWDPVLDVTSYQARLTGAGAAIMLTSLSNHITFSGLVANRDYVFQVQALKDADSSDYTEPIEICTRMPTPPAPGVSPLPGMVAGVIVHWDWSGLTIDESDPVQTEILRETASYHHTIHTDLTHAGYLVDTASTGNCTYTIALVSHKRGAPNGINRAHGAPQTAVLVPMADHSASNGFPHEMLMKLAYGRV